jgi:transcriptional regulator with XRE-family HTH domain
MMDERLLNMEVHELARLMKKARAAENNKRKAAGSRELTQGDIANIIQVSATAVSDWEQGKKHPGFLNVLKYCDVLGITPDELVGIKTNRRIAVESTEEERDMMLSMIHDCEQETELSRLQSKIHTLAYQLKALFSRAQPQ